MAARYNPPPSWPPPPEGWTPPAGWQPDPTWGPPPPGWQFWVDDGSASGSTQGSQPPAADGGRRRRPNADAWKRTGIIAGITFLVIAIPSAVVSDNPGYATGTAFARVAIPFLITAVIAFLVKRRWGWWPYLALFFGLFVFFAIGSLANSTP